MFKDVIEVFFEWISLGHGAFRGENPIYPFVIISTAFVAILIAVLISGIREGEISVLYSIAKMGTLCLTVSNMLWNHPVWVASVWTAVSVAELLYLIIKKQLRMQDIKVGLIRIPPSAESNVAWN